MPTTQPPTAAPTTAFVLGFLLTAPLFAIGAAFVLLWAGPDALLTRWSPTTLAMVHLFTLGYLTLTMMGALTQMLPVIAGAELPVPRLGSLVSGAGVVLGTVLLAAGLGLGHVALIRAALPCLATGLLAFVASMSWAAWRAPSGVPAAAAIRLALAGLAVTGSLGLVLGHGVGGGVPALPLPALTDLHAAWGLAGWLGMLIMAVALQVVPMFQMTPPYQASLARWLPRCLLGMLTAGSVAAAWMPALARHAVLPAAACLAVFAVATLDLQRRRRRRQANALVWFWRAGLVSLLGCLLPLACQAADLPTAASGWPALALGCLFLVGFCSAVVNGMLYKIVPFLVWTRAQAEPTLPRVRNVRDLLGERAMLRQFAGFVLALVLLLAAVPAPEVWARPAGCALVVSFAWMWINLFRAARRHLYVRAGRAP